MFDTVKFGEKLRDHRRKLGITQEEAATAVGVSPQAVSKWENGECLPDCWNLKLIGETYGISLDILMDTDNGDIVSAADKIEQIGDEYIWSKADRNAELAHRDLGDDLWKMWKGLYFIECGDKERQRQDKEKGNLRISSEYGMKIWDDDGIACVIKSSLKEHIGDIADGTVDLLRFMQSQDCLSLIRSIDTTVPKEKSELLSLGIDSANLNEMLITLTENRIIEFTATPVSGKYGYKLHASCGITAYMLLAAAYIIQKKQYTTSEYLPN